MATTAITTEVDSVVEQQAAEVLADAGLSTSDFVRIALRKVAREKSIPAELLQVNDTTMAAIQAGDRGEVTTYESVDDLFADLDLERD